MENRGTLMRKNFLPLLLLLSFLISLPAFAVVSSLNTNVRISGSSTDPFNSGQYSGLTSATLNGGVISLLTSGEWQAYQFPGGTVSVPNTVGQMVDVFVKPGTNAGTTTTELDAWNPTPVQFTLSSATAANPCVITTSATPTGITVNSWVFISSGTATGPILTDSTYGLNGKFYQVSAVSGSTITLSGSNTLSLATIGVSGALITLVPSTRNTALSIVNGIPVQTSNNSARLIGTFFTGARGVSGQAESSPTLGGFWNVDDYARTTLLALQPALAFAPSPQAYVDYFGLHVVATTQNSLNIVVPVINQLRLYPTSGNAYSSSYTAGTTLFIGGRPDGNQCTFNQGAYYMLIAVPQTAFTVSGLTTGKTYDLYMKNINGTISTTVVVWPSGPPTRGSDSYGRATLSSDTTYLQVGTFYANSATTVSNFTSVSDTILAGINGEITGAVKLWVQPNSSVAVPSGYALCNGQTATWQTGVLAGSTFTTPNYIGMFPIGADILGGSSSGNSSGFGALVQGTAYGATSHAHSASLAASVSVVVSGSGSTGTSGYTVQGATTGSYTASAGGHTHSFGVTSYGSGSGSASGTTAAASSCPAALGTTMIIKL